MAWQRVRRRSMTGRVGAETPSWNAPGASARRDASMSVSSPVRFLLGAALLSSGILPGIFELHTAAIERVVEG